MAEADITELRKQCIDSLLQCADNVSKYVDIGKDAELNKLKKYLESYCFSEAQQNAEALILKEVKESNATNLDKLDDIVIEQLRRITQTNDISTHPLINELEHRIERNSRIVTQNFDESDLAITEAEERHTDPITLKPIENPVRNIICNHVYERDVIHSYMKQKSGAKCPVVGCVSQQPLQSKNLKPDEEYGKFRKSQEQMDAAHSQEY
ncbi:E3 SUMO-protein ligase NSE2-like [Vanessa cardui]|uniref:E3 SUMO-protein ligase NSE2-like n=1 Tax=Vanessa cardui TaxID=171605 RepID=UPI001F13282C|nr:E3 SUMO-protein ligase NSE2-like [Vanessa cardui]